MITALAQFARFDYLHSPVKETPALIRRASHSGNPNSTPPYSTILYYLIRELPRERARPKQTSCIVQAVWESGFWRSSLKGAVQHSASFGTPPPPRRNSLMLMLKLLAPTSRLTNVILSRGQQGPSPTYLITDRQKNTQHPSLCSRSPNHPRFLRCPLCILICIDFSLSAVHLSPLLFSQ